MNWMKCMETYGQSWLEDIGKAYFSQEYWYLFTVTLTHYWRSTPLNVSDACDSMKTGSSKTRENRLRKIIAEHFFVKTKNRADLRQTWLQPTPEMLLNGRRHFRNSLERTIRSLLNAQLLASSSEPLLDKMLCDNEGLDKHALLPWAEFLIDYTNDWNATFGNHFHTEEYWHLFVYCLLGCWKGQPLTMGEACSCIRTGSNRTREKRISRAINRGMLTKQKSGHDLRTTFILTTETLEDLLSKHFSRTLNCFRNLAQSLQERQISFESPR